MHPGNTGNHLFGGCYMLYLPEIKHGWKSPPCMIKEGYLKLWISTQQQHIFSLLYHLNSEFIWHIIYINNIQCWQSNCKYCKCIGCYIQNLDGLLESFNILYIYISIIIVFIYHICQDFADKRRNRKRENCDLRCFRWAPRGLKFRSSFVRDGYGNLRDLS
jgi:hypothetical protein